jgi:hypothetical protein
VQRVNAAARNIGEGVVGASLFDTRSDFGVDIVIYRERATSRLRGDGIEAHCTVERISDVVCLSDKGIWEFGDALA